MSHWCGELSNLRVGQEREQILADSRWNNCTAASRAIEAD